jgi:hypothetical protein
MDERINSELTTDRELRASGRFVANSAHEINELSGTKLIAVPRIRYKNRIAAHFFPSTVTFNCRL